MSARQKKNMGFAMRNANYNSSVGIFARESAVRNASHVQRNASLTACIRNALTNAMSLAAHA